MINIAPYPIAEVDDEPGKQKFFFQSTGKTPIVKAVEYTRIQDHGLGGLYNLGFGDYDRASGTIVDDANSNNDDMRKVFSTVLDTILEFFKDHPFDTIVVQGSDSGETFAQQCKATCTHRKCVTTCKNMDRRISAYHYYVDKNMESLKNTYMFFGYIRALNRLVSYQVNVKYDAIFVSQKHPITFASS